MDGFIWEKIPIQWLDQLFFSTVSCSTISIPNLSSPSPSPADGLLGSDIHNSVQIGGAVAALRDIFISEWNM